MGVACIVCLPITITHQSDFIEHFAEEDIIALRMAEMFPEEEEGNNETEMSWDYSNEFRCSNLSVYFEASMHDGAGKKKTVIHPDSVERLTDQGSAMRFYESLRALKEDGGPEMANIARCMERKHCTNSARLGSRNMGVYGPCQILVQWFKFTPLQLWRKS